MLRVGVFVFGLVLLTAQALRADDEPVHPAADQPEGDHR